MANDRLILLQPGFSDAKYPGEQFVCIDCLPIEGLLSTDPTRGAQLDVERVAFTRPRAAVVAALDADHQSLPVLIFGDGLPPPADAQTVNGRHFVSDPRRILTLLAERHGFFKLH
ncbi:DUF3088 domain-containing protein [Pseudorhodoferax sp. Leaf265]|jgi:hypothetical protein|uniref:DUF3088 domain-containing protein n=1 Tax=Pseudorhodoferax sp. Leaf265 TaxID=1736315 RepID=UPI0006F9459C|nr:DUF3088 domain-containing protein [Pseudorhodoferax sp. Leaf265]KQP06419.1 hypothetical protein ASF45_10195 [Pseudorhodoferax sp. Leaf265]PZQ03322.1 MAG: DUF3088 domain-containing protein [Variovorax paradoxus]PZQ17596.1 MAG: DUF3088 domain-containing protein [Variovorax paradoxus]